MVESLIMFLVAASVHCACWCVSSAVVVLMASPDMSWNGSCPGDILCSVLCTAGPMW